MDKSVFLLELFIKKPCKNCLVQACCTSRCIELHEWYSKNNFLVKLNELLMLAFGLVTIVWVVILEKIRIINKDIANSFIKKVEKVVDRNIKTRRI
jgi:hypothetical protein